MVKQALINSASVSGKLYRVGDASIVKIQAPYPVSYPILEIHYEDGHFEALHGQAYSVEGIFVDNETIDAIPLEDGI